uniref:Pru domain-containing protein n=1 Tax=Caenorhabditis tropicalis TaxID=1561998 RepID=A0A1I7UR62_9PELO
MMFNGPPPPPPTDKRVILSARMGRSLLIQKEGSVNPNEREVVAQPEKGLFYIELDDSKIPHVRWKNRVTKEIQLDLMILPDDVIFKRIRNVEGEQVYLLKYRHNRDAYPEGGIYAFWMQDLGGDKNGDFADKVHRELNFNSLKRLDPTGNHKEPPKEVAPAVEPVEPVDSEGSAGSPDPIAEAVVEASSEPSEDASEDASSEDTSSEAEATGESSQRVAAEGSPNGPVAKRNRPDDEEKMGK